MFMPVTSTVAAAIHMIVLSIEPICNSAPIIMMLEIAFVTLINGEDQMMPSLII